MDDYRYSQDLALESAQQQYDNQTPCRHTNTPCSGCGLCEVELPTATYFLFPDSDGIVFSLAQDSSVLIPDYDPTDDPCPF